MTNRRSRSRSRSKFQIPQATWETADEFCPRVIVARGLILSVSTIGHSIFLINRLRLPSSMTLISSESHSETESIQSIVIENVSKLEGIEAKAFEKTQLEFPKFLSLLDFWVRNVFLIAVHFPRLHLNPVQDCHELTIGHSIELV
jgi:hypothetical protein